MTDNIETLSVAAAVDDDDDDDITVIYNNQAPPPVASPPTTIESPPQSGKKKRQRRRKPQLTLQQPNSSAKTATVPVPEAKHPSPQATPTRSKPTAVNHHQPPQYETIQTHFINNNSIYFIVRNEASGRKSIDTHQMSAPIYYPIKPLWYLAGTPALQNYYASMTSNDKAFVPISATKADNSYGARPMRKLLANMYRCTVTAAPGHPKTDTESMDYSLYIPGNDWGQLAHYRLSHFKIDRVVACATMLVEQSRSSNGRRTAKSENVNVYVVRWQNESSWQSELLPVEQLQNFTQHDFHHQMVLDYWEEACVQDSRDFRSAASVCYSHQNTEILTNDTDKFWLKCVHRFYGRQFWTDAQGLPSKTQQELFVYKYIGWPLTTGYVSSEKLQGIEFDSERTEKEQDELDPRGFDEYLQLLVYDKFDRAVDNSDSVVVVLPEDLSERKLFKTRNVVPYTAHVPRNWGTLGEQHARQNEKVEILGVFKQAKIANVYLVQWPEYEQPTLVASLTLRKRHARFMVKFFDLNVYMPKIQLYKPEEEVE